MAQSNKPKFFQNVARGNKCSCSKTPQTNRGNGKRTHATNEKNLRSTKKAPQTVAEEEVPQEKNNEEMHLVYATIQEYDELGRIYTDQTGRLPVMSSKGNKYVMELYSYDANEIMAEPIKNSIDEELTRAYIKKLQELIKAGYKLRVHWLNNEAPSSLKQYDEE
eukprot:2304799-Ditylum_brightwellii.AAC.1